MTKRSPHKLRICRQVGEDIWGLASAGKKFKLEKSPGEQGKVHRKVKDTRYEPKYLTQLREKQKIKKYYGEISESQFAQLFERGMALKGEVFQNIFSLLERRLDAVIYRMGFVASIFEARQFINHGHVLVNGRVVTASSFQVKDYDLVTLDAAMKEKALSNFEKRTRLSDLPPYIEVDLPSLRGMFLRAPQTNEIPYATSMNLRAVIEFYSR